MSVRFDAATGEYLERTANLPNYNSTYTVMAWFYISTDQNDDGTLMIIAASGAAYDSAALGADGTTLTAWNNAGSQAGTNLTAGRWYHIAMVRSSATSQQIYLDGVLNLTQTTSVGTSRTAPDSMTIGNSVDFTADNFNGRVEGFKFWSAALTGTEITDEMYSLGAVRTANLEMETYLKDHTVLTDTSGNSRDWTAVGTLSTEAVTGVPDTNTDKFYAKVNAVAGPATAIASPTTDPGFRPKGIMVWSGSRSAAGGAANAEFSLGMAGSATTEISGGFNALDAAVSSDAVRTMSTTNIINLTDVGATTARSLASLTSFDAFGFTPTWGTQDVASALYDYLAIGGTDVTNVETGTFASNTGTGNQAVVLSGAFQPDIVFLFGTLLTAAGNGNNNSQYSLGVMDGSGNQWSITQKEQNSQATMNNSRVFSNTRCFVMQNTVNNTYFQEMSFVSMNADGFTFNIDTAGGTAILIGYMAVKGGQWKVGSETTATTTTTKATTGVGFQPECLLFGSVGGTASATSDHARFMWGASDGTRHVCHWTGSSDNVPDSVTDTYFSSTKSIVIATEGTPTVNCDGSVSALGADGFTMNYSTADGTAYMFGYVAGAGEPVVGSTTRRYSLGLTGVG